MSIGMEKSIRRIRQPTGTIYGCMKVLSRRFRSLLTRFLREAWHEGTIKLPERVLADSVALDLLLARAARTDWVVYCKPPFGGPGQVLAYLANYTHRIAISNSRIVSFDGERVSFRYRDYAHGNTEKLLTLNVDKFLRRFLLHVLPPRLVRVRYYGFLANPSRAHSIDLARRLIGGHFLPPIATLSTDEITVALNAVPARCGSSETYQPNGHRHHARPCCDHLPSTTTLDQTASSRGPVPVVSLHNRVRAVSTAPAHSVPKRCSAFATPASRVRQSTPM